MAHAHTHHHLKPPPAARRIGPNTKNERRPGPAGVPGVRGSGVRAPGALPGVRVPGALLVLFMAACLWGGVVFGAVGFLPVHPAVNLLLCVSGGVIASLTLAWICDHLSRRF